MSYLYIPGAEDGDVQHALYFIGDIRNNLYMKTRSSSDFFWLVKYRLLVRLGRDPMRKKNGSRRQYKRIGLKRVAVSGPDANKMAFKALSSPRFFIARLGFTECRTFGYFRQYELGMLKDFPVEKRIAAKELSGIFSNDDDGLALFCDALVRSLNKVTHLAVFFTEYEPMLIKHYCNKKVELFNSIALEHFAFSPSWMSILHGKKVLVVSPFADTIKSQYEKREHLFSDSSANPLFAKLSIVRSEVTFANQKPRFKDWITTLNHMFDECMKCDFEVAIISCGGYGMPLGGMLYSAGKNVIHAGGIAQLYFGVFGTRYETAHYRSWINDNWVRPSEKERPSDFRLVEGGAYW